MRSFIEFICPHNVYAYKTRATPLALTWETEKIHYRQYNTVTYEKHTKEWKDSERLMLRNWYLTKERNSVSHQSRHFTEDTMMRRKGKGREGKCKQREMLIKGRKWYMKIIHNITTLCVICRSWEVTLQSSPSPCWKNALHYPGLLQESIRSRGSGFWNTGWLEASRSRRECFQRESFCSQYSDEDKLGLQNCDNPGLHNSLTLAKNLISCSWGDFSTRPLLTTASVKHISKYDNISITGAIYIYFKLHKYNYIRCLSICSASLPHSTEMSNELLCNFHPFQQLL